MCDLCESAASFSNRSDLSLDVAVGVGFAYKAFLKQIISPALEVGTSSKQKPANVRVVNSLGQFVKSLDINYDPGWGPVSIRAS